jgi:glycosyltransferase involved in cell wall biosynthesis
MISVCMAVYNGSRFLATQLQSIVVQLEESDEIVIVDDASCDTSVRLIERLAEPRIRLFRNEANVGAIRSFERALAMSRGDDMIFFADQDDLWLPGKVEKMRRAMREADATAVVSDAIVIDEEGHMIKESFFVHRKSGPGLLKNFIKNTYLGCCLAFDARVRDVLLPFPSWIPQHDEWIGTACEIVGQVAFMKTPLVAYRRHSGNASSLTRSSFLKIAKRRTGLAAGVVGRLPRLLKRRLVWRQTRS